MTALDRVLDALRALGLEPRQRGAQWECRCPAHDDRRASFGFAQPNGKVLLNCQAGCTPEAIVAALGLTLRDLFDDAERIKPREVAAYTYTDETGTPLFEVVRFEPKDFRQRRPDGTWGVKGVRRVLYNLPAVLAAAADGGTVYLVEGEKDADRYNRDADLAGVATTNPGGAGKWSDDYSASLKGAHVVIVADRDGPGRKHAAAVRRSLAARGIPVRVTEPAAGKDLSDHLDAGLSIGQLVAVTDALDLAERHAPETAAPSAPLVDPDEPDSVLGPALSLTGWRSAQPVLWYCDSILAPGVLTAFSAAGGRKKSLLALTLAVHLAAGVARPWLGVFRTVRDPLRVLILDGECGPDRLRRRLRELVLGGHFTPDEADRALANIDIRSIGTIVAPALAIAAVERLLDRTPYDLIVFDPLRYFLPARIESENDNLSMGRLLDDMHASAVRHKAAVLVNAHDSAVGRALRGASSQQNAVETLWQIEQPDDNDRNYLTFRAKKDRDPGAAWETGIRLVCGEPVPEGGGELRPVRIEGADVRVIPAVTSAEARSGRAERIVGAVETIHGRSGTAATGRSVAELTNIPERTCKRELRELADAGRIYHPGGRAGFYPAAAKGETPC